MKCKICGYEYSDDKAFCPMCGAEKEDGMEGNNSDNTWNTKEFPKPVQEIPEMNIHWSAPDASEGYVSVSQNEEKKPEKFYTFQAKNEEFQKLLDQEFERLKNIQKETEKLNIKTSYDSLFEPKVAAVVENPVPQFFAAPEKKNESKFAEEEITKGIISKPVEEKPKAEETVVDNQVQKPQNTEALQKDDPEPMHWPSVGNMDKPIEKANPVWPSSQKKRTPAEIYAAMMAAEEFEEKKKAYIPKAKDNNAFDQMIMNDTKDVSEVPDASPLNLDAEPMAPDVKDMNAFDIKFLEYSIRQIEEEEQHAQKESEERRKKLEAMAAARDAYFKCLDDTDNQKKSRVFGFRREKPEEKPVVTEYVEKPVSKIEIPLETPVVIKPVPATDFFSVEPIKSVEEIIEPLTEDTEHTTQFDKVEFRAAQKKIEAEFLRIQSAEESETNPSEIEDATPIFTDAAEEESVDIAVSIAEPEDIAAEEAIVVEELPEETEVVVMQGLPEETESVVVEELPEVTETAAEEQPFINENIIAEKTAEEAAEEVAKETVKQEEPSSEKFGLDDATFDEFDAMFKKDFENEPTFEDIIPVVPEVFEAPEQEVLMGDAAYIEEPAEIIEEIAEAVKEAVEEVEETVEKVEEPAEKKEEKTDFDRLSLEMLEASVAEMAATHNEKGDLSLDESGNVILELKNEDIKFEEFENIFASYREHDDVDDTIDTKDIQAALENLEANENDDEELEYNDEDDDDEDGRSAKRGGILRFLFLTILIIVLIQGAIFALGKLLPDAGIVQTLMAIAESVQDAFNNLAGSAVDKIMSIF